MVLKTTGGGGGLTSSTGPLGTVRVRMLVNGLSAAGKRREKGEEFDCPSVIAYQLFKRNAGELVKAEAKPEATATETVSAPASPELAADPDSAKEEEPPKPVKKKRRSKRK